MNTAAEMLNKIIQVRFIPEMPDWLNIGTLVNILHHPYQIKEKNLMINSKNAGKAFDKSNTHLLQKHAGN